MIRPTVALAGALLVATAASAQVAPLAPVAPAGAAVLRTGTPVALRTREELTIKGKTLRVGHRFQMEVAEAVTVNGQVVIPAGSPAMGEITDVRNKGMWGKSGKINARALHVRVGDRTIRLTGQLDDKGKAGGVGAVAASALIFAPAGFFMTGTSARIPLGAPMSAFIDEDVPLAFSAAAQAPLQVGAPAAPMAVPTSR
ncbi:hypothetical protein [Sphingomonas lenta]|uniref:DUF5666 domain-containing protein n=1 Tax=Sphingomonas lenta TaxID=1141887 RepID=A0A2A2SJA3_9SPHN|nr:hypothetical protein [Sphingomonas lenta]PAX09364.1 hypothetical protein CKY28_00995 [Sphingomonas lenta]